MMNFMNNLYKLYKATKGVNTTNKDGSLQIYNTVEDDKYLYIVISKEVCKKYGFDPDIQFLKMERNNE